MRFTYNTGMCIDMYSDVTRSIERLITSLAVIFSVILDRCIIVFIVRYQGRLIARKWKRPARDWMGLSEYCGSLVDDGVQ